MALGTTGAALWTALHSALDDEFDFDERELSILALAARQADDVAALELAVERDGITVAGSKGQTRLHPAVVELRQARLAVSRLLGELELPAADAEPRSARSKRAQRAANVRWATVAQRTERARGA